MIVPEEFIPKIQILTKQIADNLDIFNSAGILSGLAELEILLNLFERKSEAALVDYLYRIIDDLEDSDLLDSIKRELATQAIFSHLEVFKEVKDELIITDQKMSVVIELYSNLGSSIKEFLQELLKSVQLKSMSEGLFNKFLEVYTYASKIESLWG
jgi:RecJ-like exonuclease